MPREMTPCIHLNRLRRTDNTEIRRYDGKEYTMIKWMCDECDHYIWMSIAVKGFEQDWRLSMRNLLKVLCGMTLVLFLLIIPVSVKATNESSYQYGFMSGSLKSPNIVTNANWYPRFDNYTCRLSESSILNSGAILPAITNTTACEDGFFAGYRDWCLNHAVNCIRNMTIGDYPPIISQAHEQYVKGFDAVSSRNSMCPIGENAAFCNGWDSNNDDYGRFSSDCSDEPLANITADLVGCPGDIMYKNQIGGAGFPTLVGTWDYVNGTRTGEIVYGNVGDFHLTIPNRNFGDYKLEGSWGYIGHDILTECYDGGCDNNTLTAVTPNHVEFIDNHGDTIHLMKPMANHFAKLQPATGATTKLVSGSYRVNLLGTWSVNQSESTITFDSFIKYAHWKYTPYCCDVNIQKFDANIGHRTFGGYWNSEIWGPNPVFPNTLELCTYNIQDHGEYHDNISGFSPLSGCTKMVVDVINHNHLNLHSPAGVIYLVRKD